MPADFLLPLFALTLLANAFLVAAAIRGLRRGDADPDLSYRTDPAAMATRPAARADARPMTAELARAIAARRRFVEDEPAAASAAPSAPGPGEAVEAAPGPAATAEPVAAAEAAAARGPAESAAGADGLGDVPPTPPKAPRRRRPAKVRDAGATTGDGPGTTEPAGRGDAAGDAAPAGRRTAGPARSAEARSRPGDTARRGRRRFSLPPLDDDHERVSRSIESFLGGTDAASPDEPAAAEPSAGATTVAFVALDDAAAADAIALVERTIRGAARGTDIVTVAEPGRFRIVLPATGELAARAYLRRIRATVEPLLGTAERPVGLAVATATALDEPIEDAIGRAERRLGAALEAARRAAQSPLADDADETADPAPAPRSAVD